MNADVTQSGKTSVVKLEGSWTIERANELKIKLLDAMNSSASIVLDLEGLTDLDLSTIQLFCSAHRTSLRDGKHLALHSRMSQSMKRMVGDVGFMRTLGCRNDLYKKCLWIGDRKS